MTMAIDDRHGIVAPVLAPDQHGGQFFDIRRLLSILRRDWMVILLFAAIGFYVGVLMLRGAIYSYPVQMQVTSVATNATDNAPNATLSAVGSLVGLQGGMPSSPGALQFRLFQDSLFTRDMADRIAKNQDIMIKVFPGQWDPVRKAWFEPPSSDLHKEILQLRAWLGLAPSFPWHPPGGLELLGFMKDTIQVEADPRRPYLLTIVMTYPDTQFAVQFLNLLRQTADDYLRQRSLARAKENIAYLSNELSHVTVAEHRAALTATMSEQEKFAMSASSNAPFSAEIFERPWASTLPSSPSPRQVFAIAVILGGLVGALVAEAVRRIWRLTRQFRPRHAGVAIR